MENKKRLIWNTDVYCRLVDLAEKRGSVAIPAGMIIKILFDESLAVDAVEVVHGRWEWYREENCVICSECKDMHYLGAYHQYSKNYCPNCGAKMDGERKANDRQRKVD